MLPTATQTKLSPSRPRCPPLLHFGQHLTHVVLHCFTRTICNLQRVNDGPDNHERQPIGDQDKQRRQQADRAEDRPPFEFWRQWPRSSTLPIDSQIGERARRKRRILPGTSDINNINACNVIYVLVHSFTKVNIREVEGVQLMFDIKETPTFVFIKYEEQIDEEVATQHTVNKKLENLIKKIQQETHVPTLQPYIQPWVPAQPASDPYMHR